MAVDGRMIVDAQAHLWKAESPDWPWVPGRKPQLPEPFTIEKLLPMMDEAGVDRVVIVPPSWPGDRNDYALEAVKRHPTRFAVMGRLPVEKRAQAEAMLPKWKEQPGMLGVRLTFQNDMMKLLTEGHVGWFWPVAEKLDLPVMFFAPRNIPKFAPIAARHPGLRMIIDHGMVETEDVVLWGARNLDPPEAEFIGAHGITDDPAPVLARVDAVYVAIDCDVLEPGEMAVFMPEPGGPSFDGVEQLLSGVRESGKLAGAGFTGLAPEPANAEKLQRLTAALGL